VALAIKRYVLVSFNWSGENHIVSKAKSEIFKCIPSLRAIWPIDKFEYFIRWWIHVAGIFEHESVYHAQNFARQCLEYYCAEFFLMCFC
jgi:hypothetical protein